MAVPSGRSALRRARIITETGIARPRLPEMDETSSLAGGACRPERPGRRRSRRRPLRRSSPQGRPLAHHILTATELTEEFLHGGRQRRIVQTVDHVLTLALIDDEIRLFQDRKVARNRRLRQIEIADNLTDRTLTSFQQPEDLLPGTVRQGL